MTYLAHMTLTSVLPTAPPQTKLEEQTSVPVGLQRFEYTVERYHAAIAAGVITENDRVELLYGQIVKKLQLGRRHTICLATTNKYFLKRVPDNQLCWPQNSITIPNQSEPEPDFAVVNVEWTQRRTHQPEPPDILLLIEIADSSLEVDRDTKGPLYALAGITKYWIINLRQNQIEVHTQPDTAAGIYNSIQRYPAGSTFDSPFNGATVVDDFIPA